MRRAALLVLVALALPWLPGCTGSGGVGGNDDPLTFVAIVREVSDGTLMVESREDVGFGLDMAAVHTADIEDLPALEPGQWVRLTTQPEIAESYPVQIRGIAVELLPEDEIRNYSYQKIGAEEAKARMEDGAPFVLVDVRTPEEFKEGHIEGALLLPDYEVESSAAQLLPDKDARILLYCRTGRRSEGAAMILVAMGYTNVIDFGGITDWPYEIIRE